MAKAPELEVQIKAALMIRDLHFRYRDDTEVRRQELVDVYEAWSSFKEDIQNNWSSSFKVNKAHEVVEKVLPRIVAKNPRWIVSKRKGQIQDDHIAAVQDYLTTLFEQRNLGEPVRLWAKNMILNGKGYAKAIYKYDTQRSFEDLPTGELNEDGEPVMERTMVDKVVGEYPTIEIMSWTDVFYDPKFVLACDRPAWIIQRKGLRLSDLKNKGEDYINLDKIDEAAGVAFTADDYETYRNQIYNITGVDPIDDKNTQIDKNSLDLKIFYGWFSEDEEAENEKLYEIWMLENLVICKYKEIASIPIEEIKAFEDPETAYARGFVEPMLAIQEEMNFKKNTASEYINKALTRQFVWSQNSGIDPRNFNNPVIPTTTDGQTALANFVELPHREIHPSFFQEQNDMERQVQAMTFTVDTSNPRSENALTNTATGARIKFFESNSVINEVRKHFEEGLSRLAYKLLELAFENMDDNLVIKKTGEDGYWEINKELLKDAVEKYHIRVETNSSAFDDIESRREDAIARWNISLQAAQAGVKVDLAKSYKDVLDTFEVKNVDQYVKPPSLQESLQQVGISAPTMSQPERSVPNEEAAELTTQVAQGNLTTI